mgnify:CR=1 FL=1
MAQTTELDIAFLSAIPVRQIAFLGVIQCAWAVAKETNDCMLLVARLLKVYTQKAFTGEGP